MNIEDKINIQSAIVNGVMGLLSTGSHCEADRVRLLARAEKSLDAIEALVNADQVPVDLTPVYAS